MNKIWIIRSIDRGWDGGTFLLGFSETEQEAEDLVKKKSKKYKEKYPNTSLYFDYIELLKYVHSENM